MRFKSLFLSMGVGWKLLTVAICLPLLGAQPAPVPDDCEGCEASMMPTTGTDFDYCPGTPYYVRMDVEATSGSCIEEVEGPGCDAGSPCGFSVTHKWKLECDTPVRLCNTYSGVDHCVDPPPIAVGIDETLGPLAYVHRCGSPTHKYSTSGAVESCGTITAAVFAACSVCE